MSLLNLLTPERKKMLATATLLFGIRAAMRQMILLLVVGTLVLGIGTIALRRELRSLQQNAQERQHRLAQQQGGLPEQRVQQFNERLAAVANVQKGFQPWSATLAAVSDVLPAGVTLSTLDLDGIKRSLHLTGVAASRDALLALQRAFSSSTRFKNPTTPVSNLLEQSNITFDMTVDIITP